MSRKASRNASKIGWSSQFRIYLYRFRSVFEMISMKNVASGGVAFMGISFDGNNEIRNARAKTRNMLL